MGSSKLYTQHDIYNQKTKQFIYKGHYQKAIHDTNLFLLNSNNSNSNNNNNNNNTNNNTIFTDLKGNPLDRIIVNRHTKVLRSYNGKIERALQRLVHNFNCIIDNNKGSNSSNSNSTISSTATFIHLDSHIINILVKTNTTTSNNSNSTTTTQQQQQQRRRQQQQQQDKEEEDDEEEESERITTITITTDADAGSGGDVNVDVDIIDSDKEEEDDDEDEDDEDESMFGNDMKLIDMEFYNWGPAGIDLGMFIASSYFYYFVYSYDKKEIEKADLTILKTIKESWLYYIKSYTKYYYQQNSDEQDSDSNSQQEKRKKQKQKQRKRKKLHYLLYCITKEIIGYSGFWIYRWTSPFHYPHVTLGEFLYTIPNNVKNIWLSKRMEINTTTTNTTSSTTRINGLELLRTSINNFAIESLLVGFGDNDDDIDDDNDDNDNDKYDYNNLMNTFINRLIHKRNELYNELFNNI